MVISESTLNRQKRKISRTFLGREKELSLSLLTCSLIKTQRERESFDRIRVTLSSLAS